MLEVRNLSKIYKAKKKNGTDTRALDNVSLCFPERGMVFLLGKSGSGKSTLLNVCGGLDAPTSGEIIVKGRSSKNFSQSDFDSYRNTFVGFIFQEYNILNEFTVEDNIALALELQGKPKDKKAIAELLEQVDLTGFAKRKPNTLSGGQKQRIAIARALVKSPEIIMADEPTGALDSATGKQVFDTLKKLSANKLVLVVSHDREFAELYADRIIELKDGKILSDVSKTQEKQESISKNITAIGDILCIKQGSDLTDDDFDRIKRIIKNNSGDIIIAGSKQDVQNFKKVNRITSDGEKEVFKDTDESKTEKKSYTPEQSKFIRSKLPARHAAKIGVSGLKTKPIRLFFTIVLCVISFVLFGVLSTLMLYNSESMFKQTLKDSSHDFVVFDKVYKVENSYYENGVLLHSYTDSNMSAKFSSKEIEKISQTFGKGSFGAINVSAQVNVRQASSFYWQTYFTSAAYMDESAFLRNNITGSYPQNDNEICISSYMANLLTECKAIDENGSLINVDYYMDFVGKNIIIDGISYKITGIFDSGEIDPKFDAIKDGTNNNYSLISEFESLLNDGTHLLIALSKDGLETFAERYDYSYHYGENNRYGNGYIDDGSQINIEGENFDGPMNGSQVYYGAFSELKSSAYLSFTDKITAIKDNQAIVPFNSLHSSISNKIYAARDEISSITWYLDDFRNQINSYDEYIATQIQPQLDTINTEIDRLTAELATYDEESDNYYDVLNSLNYYKDEKNNCEDQLNNTLNERNNVYATLLQEFNIKPEELQEKYDEYQSEYNKLDNLNSILNIIACGQETTFSEEDEPIVKNYSVAERGELLSTFLAEYPEFVSGIKYKFCLSSNYGQSPLTEEKSYDVVGVIIPAGTIEFYVQDVVYFNDKVVEEYWEIQKSSSSYSESSTNYKDEEGAIFTKLYVPYNHSDAQTNYLWSVYQTEDFAKDDSKIKLNGGYIDSLQMIDLFVVELSTIFLYVGLVLAAFAILLFSNFISVSISQKRREIGILRAVGARSFDVFKIFFSESLVVAAICSALAIVGSSLLCQVLNTELGSALGASIFVFGILSILIICAIAVLTAILATFVPVWNAAKKKPVDSIRAL